MGAKRRKKPNLRRRGRGNSQAISAGVPSGVAAVGATESRAVSRAVSNEPTCSPTRRPSLGRFLRRFKARFTPVPEGMVRYHCHECGSFEDVPLEIALIREAQKQAAQERARMRADYRRWVREHGVEGAKLIADCMD